MPLSVLLASHKKGAGEQTILLLGSSKLRATCDAVGLRRRKAFHPPVSTCTQGNEKFSRGFKGSQAKQRTQEACKVLSFVRTVRRQRTSFNQSV